MKLSAKAAAVMVPLAAAAAYATFAQSRSAVHAALSDRLAQRAVESVAARADGAAEALEKGDARRLSRLLRTMAAETQAVSAAALDPQGRILAHTDPSESGRTYRDPATLAGLRAAAPFHAEAGPRGEPVLQVFLPVWSKDNPIRRLGTISIGRSFAGSKAAEDMITARLRTILLAATAFMLSALFLLLRLLHAPIRALAEGAGRISRGEFGATIASNSSDELGALARVFNEMSQRLAKTSLSKDFLSNVLRNMLDALFVANPDGTIRMVNPAALELLGYAEGELVGKPLLFLFPEEDRVMLEPSFSKLRRGGSLTNLDLAFQGKSRNRIPVILSGSVISGRDGSVTGIICGAKDITERKRAELFLDGQAKVLELILSGESLPALLESICRQIDGQARQVTASILLLEDRRLRLGAAPGLPEELKRALDGTAVGPRTLSCGAAAYGEKSVICPDIASDPLWAVHREAALSHGLRACWSLPVLSREGRVLGTLDLYCREARGPTDDELRLLSNMERLAAIAIERKRFEEALKKSEDQLRRSEKLSAVGQLAAGVAHEINNPLGIILGFAQASEKRISNSHALALPLQSIAREALRCKNLVSELLTFSRQQAARTLPMDLNAAVEGTMGLIAAQARVRAVEIVKDLRAQGLIDGDKNQLQQVVVNLASNAIDAMPQGGRVTLRTKNHAGDGRLRVVLEVEDTGVGIPEAIRDKIFNPFFTTKEVGKGTGLGLALVHEIVTRHHGSIEVESVLGRGSVFRVNLPLRNGDEAKDEGK